MVGASVADIRLTGTTERTGNSKGYPYNPAKMPYYYTGIVQKISDEEFRELLGHEIPNGRWSGNLEINDAICQMYYAKSRLARLIYRYLTKMKRRVRHRESRSEYSFYLQYAVSGELPR